MAEQAVQFSIKAKDQTAAVFAKVKGNIGSLSKVALGLGAAVAGVAGIGALGSMAKDAMSTADRIHKLNLRLGASTEALSQYRHAANLSGVSFNEFVNGLEKMSRNVGEAAQDTGTAKDALEELGLSAQTLARMKPEEQFEILADAIAKVEGPTDRTRLAMDVFGRSGGALLQMMAGGSEGLREMRQEADALGMTMSKEMVTGVADANDAIAKITARVMSMVESMMGSLAPSIKRITDGMGQWMDKNKDWINQNIPKLIDDLTLTVKTLLPALQAVWDVFLGVGDAIGWVAFKLWELDEAMDNNLFKGLLTGGRLSLMESVQKMGAGAPAGQQSEAAALAASGGGEPMDAGFWQGSGGGTVVNNFNTQITRGDAVAISAESARQASRQ